MEVWGVVFADAKAFGEAGWLVTHYQMEVVGRMDSFLREKEDPENPGVTQCVASFQRTNQDHYKATVWTAYTVPPSRMLTVSDMPGLTDAYGEDLLIDWRCTSFEVKFDRETLLYNCEAQYEAWGKPVSSQPQEWIVPTDLAEFQDITPEDPT